MTTKRDSGPSIDDMSPYDWDRVAKQREANVRLRNIVDNIKIPEEDVVNRPHHYNTGSIECIEASEESMEPDQFKGYLKGNIMKYLWRYDYKGKPVEDLRKARWYLEKLIETEL